MSLIPRALEGRGLFELDTERKRLELEIVLAKETIRLALERIERIDTIKAKRNET